MYTGESVCIRGARRGVEFGEQTQLLVPETHPCKGKGCGVTLGQEVIVVKKSCLSKISCLSNMCSGDT